MEATDTVVHVERVCCLECATKYMKPAHGGTDDGDSGCPRCGYAGWISALVAPRRSTPGGPRRYGAGLHQSPAARPH